MQFVLIFVSTLFLSPLLIPSDVLHWQNLDPSVSPSPRRSHTMAYDPQNDIVLLFGGFGNGTHLGDTWVYDMKMNSWREMMPDTSPSPRAATTLVYDQKHKNFLLYGGFGHDHVLVFNDTWSYDYKSNSWRDLKPENSPAERASYGMAYDTKRNLVAMFGGFTEHKYYNELWMYDPAANSWEQKVTSVVPPVRGSPGFTYDSKADVFVLFGGFSEEGFFNDTWIYDPKSNIWKKVEPAVSPPLIRTRMVYDENNARSVFFGGDVVAAGLIDEEAIPEPSSKTWAFYVNGNRWEELSADNNPPPRSLNGIAYDSHRDSLVLFGGTDSLIDEENLVGREFYDTWFLPLNRAQAASPYGVSSSALLLPTIVILGTGVIAGTAYFLIAVGRK